MIYDPNASKSELAPIASGGGFLGLDLTNPKDMATLREALDRWPRRFGDIDSSIKARMVKVLYQALDFADNIEDPEAALKVQTEAIKTLNKMEEMNQKDEHRLMDAIMRRSQAAAAAVQVNVQNNNTFTIDVDKGG